MSCIKWSPWKGLSLWLHWLILLCLHTLRIKDHHVLISSGVMDSEFSLPLDGNYFVELTPPLLVQQPSQLPPQMTSPSQLATMPLLGIVLVPLVTKPTEDSSTKSLSPPPKNNVNSPPMSPHILAHL